ncbi:BTB/POZ domain-containing protein 9-like [Tropilaelaps mercedesae]|uniref:BTB/POZ domain-containing protein 9-like n=1 Tax=Tropilaelaps mercedesae TaxID=418985 RepID=A0A1V9WYL4_9ACAR|nr:BTB/POZ domain-containing protein 9-like [Tropilaelaps mercedesae]
MALPDRLVLAGVLLARYALAARVPDAEESPCEPGVLPRGGLEAIPSAFHDVCQAVRAYDEAFAAVNMTYKVKVLRYLEDKMAAALECETIDEMSADAFAELLCRPWRIEEVRVFRAVWRWHQKDFGRWEGKAKELLNKVHLAAIPAKLLQDEVLPSKLFECVLIIDALAVKIKHAAHMTPFLRFPGQEELNINVINSSLGAAVLSGSDAELLLHDFDPSTKPKCAWHPIADPSGIALRLGGVRILNSVTVHLLDDDGREYSYVVETSTDGANWTRVVDHSSALVKGRVTDRFAPTLAAYIRVVGNRNTNERHKANFHLYDLQASLSE